MTELNINRKKFNKGDVVYFLVNDEKIPYKKNVSSNHLTTAQAEVSFL